MSTTSSLLDSQREHELQFPFAIQEKDNKTVDDGVESHRARPTQPRLFISAAPSNDELTMEPEIPSRSGSVSSSLDPYYFGIQSPAESPASQLPEPGLLSATPETRSPNEPLTPVRDPANIDRKGLVGVGELTTPRWGKMQRRTHKDDTEIPDGEHEEEVLEEDGAELMIDEVDKDGPDSPWTIEAVESDGKDEATDVKQAPRTLRARRSIADESGGEEILYPRKPHGSDLLHPTDLPIYPPTPSEEQPSPTDQSLLNSLLVSSSAPSAFTPLRKAKKRTSDEFEMDQTGSLVSKSRHSGGSLKDRSGLAVREKDEKPASARKHRSIGSSTSGGTNRDRTRRRESPVKLADISSPTDVIPVRSDKERHTRQLSAGSSSSSHDAALHAHSRRVHTTDFSHLPPSPSTTSIQHILRHAGSATSTTNPPLRPSSSHKDIAQPQAASQAHSSPNVAHSLLRGTQEGWSGLDDDAHADALRKLDGLSTKTARARASVGSFGRPSSMSRPGTPASTAGRSGVHWEGVSSDGGGKVSRRGSTKDKKEEPTQRQPIGLGTSHSGDILQEHTEVRSGGAVSSDEHAYSSSGMEKTPKKPGSMTTRLSFTPKRGSASSTTYTSTPTSSRDSASLSVTTSMTSTSGPSASGRHSTGVGKARRNSAGSDISSVHSGGDAAAFKERQPSFAASGEALEGDPVPPVPPLPKDLSTYRSPPQTSHGITFPPSSAEEGDVDRTVSLEVPSSSSKPPSYSQAQYLQSSANRGSYSSPESVPSVTKTPSKKWSFSNALNIKLTPSMSSMRGKDSPSGKSSSFPLSPRSVQAPDQPLRKSGSREQALSPPVVPSASWSPVQPDAMASAASLASLSSIGSNRNPKSPGVPAKIPSRPGTGSSASIHTTSILSASHNTPLSPSSSIRRHQSKRLTPSSIPFFRRSSSQSMQIPPSKPATVSTSPTPLSSGTGVATPRRLKTSFSPSKEPNHGIPATPSTSHKKSSVLSLGLPSLLKSSSRRSLHGDKSDTGTKESTKKDSEKEKSKQDQKDRSESRISLLMGRKRGKTLSSTDPKKGASVITLPPMQMSALPATTAQRVASLKGNSAVSTPASSITRTTSTSRVTSQTVSSMQKQSDASLRSRNQPLPTIAGSPSVGTTGYIVPKDSKDHPPSALMNFIGLPKETPTKIPRISSRTSAAGSPGLGSATVANRRISLNVTAPSTDPSPIPGDSTINEFGVLENGDPQVAKASEPTTAKRQSVRASPSVSSRVPRQASGPPPSGGIPRKSNRDSVSFSALRKASTGSVASTNSVAPPSETTHSHRFSALSPSKGLKLLTPKISLSARSSNNQSLSSSLHRSHAGTPSSSRQSLSTPSPVPSIIDEEELLGDEEMMQYIHRQQTKKMANGASQTELDELLKFPEPIPPSSGLTPEEVLNSSQAQSLSDYEKEEILNYPQVYCIGSGSQKKKAHPEVVVNNFGYDDERGDYQVINGDHLAYRYEIMDTLGKGSFGQVLNCRDHQTGESVAIKIIRNKKRFHHQALVEIKILDNLRKWDQEEKHHVIKMTEHFYFRNHLCIAMELLSINLYELIKANGFVGFTTTLIRRFTSQMILSLCLMRHHRIVHCDLKPENVLLRHPAKSAIKVIDFGSSCFEHEKIYTYIQSRFYRSPEVILGMNYHMAIDMWSLGCILAELYTGFPIFPGENEQEQLSCIMEVLGSPDKDFINRSSRKRLFFDNNGAPRPVVNSKGRRRRPGTKSLAQVLRCQDEDFVDFIARCLVWDPERRMKPQAALQHNFLRAGRRSKISGPLPATAKSLLSSSNASSRAAKVTETPKKSQIGAPTPLTARSSRTTTIGVPSTPVHTTTAGSSSRTYRSSQSHGLASQYSSRTLGGFAVSCPSSSEMPFEQELMGWLQTTASSK